MKALKEIEAKKALSFIIYSLVQTFYHQTINHLFFIPPARKIFFQILGSKIGTGSVLMDVRFFNFHHVGPGGLTIGKDCFIGDETLIDLYDKVTLEDQVTIAQRVTILTHLNVGYKDHPLQAYFPKSSKTVEFKTGSFVGAGSIILPGVSIGERSFIAAGSVVTSDIPKDSVAAGVPAKVIKKLKK